MDTSRNINYLREFFYSKYNGILAGCTVGVGLVSGHPFLLILGLIGYGLGLMFLHDSAWFQKKINEKYDQEDKLKAYKEVEEFKARRARQLDALSSSRKQRYAELAAVGKAIEQATADSNDDGSMDTRLRKIDELIWTYLKLLTIEQSLEVFIESEREDNLPKEVEEVEERLKDLTTEIEKLRADTSTNPNVLASKERLFNSCGERKDVLAKRLSRVEQAKANIEVVKAEQERLQQQVKLIRADAIATRNTESLTSRIDASVQHLGETNKWLSEMNEFKDIVGDMPDTLTQRVGFGDDSICTSMPSMSTTCNNVPSQRVRRNLKNYIEA
jgi:DNA repair exonuclease SbcCD ATPase subunit